MRALGEAYALAATFRPASPRKPGPSPCAAVNLDVVGVVGQTNPVHLEPVARRVIAASHKSSCKPEHQISLCTTAQSAVDAIHSVASYRLLIFREKPKGQ